MPRMIQVIRKLKIGFENASEYLNSEFGINITSVNDKITDEQYEYLANYLADEEIVIPEEKSSNRVFGLRKFKDGQKSYRPLKGKMYQYKYARIISIPFGGGRKKW